MNDDNQRLPTIDGSISADPSVADAAATCDGGTDPTKPPVSLGTVDFAPDIAVEPPNGTASDPALSVVAAETVDSVPGGGTDENHGQATSDYEPGQKKGRAKKEPPVPKTVAGYEVLGVLGRGAMGVVYKAKQTGLNRLVALKMILAGEHAAPKDVARFRTEAEAVAQLQHVNIVQIYEIGEDAGLPYFSLEFVDGGSFDKKIAGAPQEPRAAARFIQTLAAAMEVAHAKGIIHRDLKPANVLVSNDGVLKISDFGLAKKLEGNAGATHSGAILGTPSYMAPEQALGKIDSIGPPADVYALGSMLYEMLTGRVPFKGTTMLDTLAQVASREPAAPSVIQDKLPRDLETICLKCLQKDPARRYPSGGPLAEDLRRFIHHEPILARPVGRIERTARWCRRNPGKASAIGLTMLGVAIYAISVSVLAVNLDRANGIAVEQTNEAKKQTGIAEQKAQIALDTSARQRETAQEALRGMVAIVERVQNATQNKRLIDASPKVLELRNQVIADLRRSIVEVNDKIKKSATATYTDLLVHELVGEMLAKLGNNREARKSYEEGRQLALARIEKAPDDDKARANLGALELHLGDVALDLEGDARTARDCYRKAWDLHDAIRREPKITDYSPIEIKRILASDDISLGRALLAMGQPAAAKKLFEEARDYRQEWLDDEKDPQRQVERRGWLGQSWMYLGVAASHLGDAASVQDCFGEALTIGNRHVKDMPKRLVFREELSEIQGQHGDALLRLGKTDDALKAYGESLANLRIWLAANVNDIAHQPALALAHERAGIACDILDKKEKAKEHFNEAYHLRKYLFDMEKDNPSRKAALIVAMARNGDVANAIRLSDTVGPREEITRSTELTVQIGRAYARASTIAGDQQKKCVDSALAALKRATNADDYRDVVYLETDPDLAPVRQEAAFTDLIAQIKKR